MTKVEPCKTCGRNIVSPAYPGDGTYPVAPMCDCPDQQPNPRRR
jgi:hypothetical protein